MYWLYGFWMIEITSSFNRAEPLWNLAVHVIFIYQWCILFTKFWLQKPQLVKGNMQLFSTDQQRSQALEAHAASFATFKVWLLPSILFCFFYGIYVNVQLFCCGANLFCVIFILMLCTGCRERKSFNSNLFCLKDLECWTNYIKAAYYWTWCSARSNFSSIDISFNIELNACS